MRIVRWSSNRPTDSATRVKTHVEFKSILKGSKHQWGLQYNSNEIADRGERDLRLRLLSGGRLNKKDGLTRYGDSHVKDKTS